MSPLDVVNALRPSITGAVHVPGEAGYDELRQPVTPDLDPRPAVVVEAGQVADVRSAVLTAREHGLRFAVQATGHGTFVPSDDGLLLCTTRMATVEIDPDRRVARVGPGAQWRQVLDAAAAHGLAPLSGSGPSVGVTGYHLGGGTGWLARAHGLAADSVLRAEVVAADGTELVASLDDNADLFWALRGGGGNFGVVTALEFQLYPITTVYAGKAYYPVARTADVLHAYGRWLADAPDELSTAITLARLSGEPTVPAPVRDTSVIMIKAMYLGEAADAEQLLRPLREAAGPPLLDEYGPIPYSQAMMGGTPAKRIDLVESLPDELVDVIVRLAGHSDAPAAGVEVRHLAGAIARPGPDAGAAGHRDAELSIIVDTPDPDAAAAELRPYATGGSYLNFINHQARLESAFTTANYQRLRAIKATYDPDNVFSVNLNVAPA